MPAAFGPSLAESLSIEAVRPAISASRSLGTLSPAHGRPGDAWTLAGRVDDSGPDTDQNHDASSRRGIRPVSRSLPRRPAN
jgi:hypothetical protein